eukprot:COSAG05_NODE_10468_length_563_cov_1.689655_1_plen_40_part_10
MVVAMNSTVNRHAVIFVKWTRSKVSRGRLHRRRAIKSVRF